VLVALAKEKGVMIDQNYIQVNLDNISVPAEAELFKPLTSDDTAAIKDCITNLYSSFILYNTYELD